MIKFKLSGSFDNTEELLNKAVSSNPQTVLDECGRRGVEALAAATPKDTGLTSESWSYEVAKTNSGYSLYWSNSNESEGVPIVILLEYGHGTRNGGFVEGIDFINPALESLFEQLAEDLWKEVIE